MQFCETCGSIVQDGQCSNLRCTSRNEALMSWLIDGTAYRFKKRLTRTEAETAVRDKSELVARVKVKPPSNGFVKIPTW